MLAVPIQEIGSKELMLGNTVIFLGLPMSTWETKSFIPFDQNLSSTYSSCLVHDRSPIIHLSYVIGYG